MISDIRTLFTQNALDSDVVIAKSIELGSTYLRWSGLDNGDVKVRQIVGGQSNLIYLVSTDSSIVPPATPPCFLLRIHCQPDVFTDTVVFSIMAERGLGPKLYGFFPGGRLEEFLPSRTLDVDSIRLSEIAERVGSLFPKYHAIDVPISKKAGAIQMIRENLERYKSLGGNVHVMRPHSVKYADEQIPNVISVGQLEHEIAVFEKWSSVFDDSIVFCHNDLAPLNVLEMNDRKELVFIDFEYASYNWRAFDLSGHLVENAFDYRVPWPGVKIDQHFVENHPNLRVFCEAYIDTMYKMKHEDPGQQFPRTEDRESEVEDLVQQCLFFIPLVNLFWAVWSLKGHVAGHENGHDLSVAASDRLSLYFHFKPKSEKIYEHFLNRI